MRIMPFMLCSSLFLRLAAVMFEIIRACVFMAIVFTVVLAFTCYWSVLLANGAILGIDAEAILGDWWGPVIIASLVTNMAFPMYLINRIVSRGAE